MWFIWWLVVWVAKIITYVASWLVGFTLYAFLILAGISGVIYIIGSVPHKITHYDPPQIDHGPIHPLEPTNPTGCAAKGALQAGAPLIRKYWTEQSDIDRLQKTIQDTLQAKQTLNINDFQQTLVIVKQNRDETYQLLVDLMQQATRNCTVEQQTQALADFQKEATGNGEMAPLVQFAKAFVSEVQAYQQTGVIDERLLRDTLPENTQ